MSISRSEALRFNSRWTEYDREIVDRELERLSDRITELVRPPSGAYLRGSGDHPRALIYVGAGYISWYSEVFESLPDRPEGVERDGEGVVLWLSTHLDTGSRQRFPDEQLTICPTCFMALPVAGYCDNCN